MPSDACWICKDRKVQCDRIRPNCSRCVQAGRQCQYGLRLSWPKSQNTRRALKHTARARQSGNQYPSDIRFVNTGVWDIRFHNCVFRPSQPLGESFEEQYLRPGFNPPLLAIQLYPHRLTKKDGELLQYFCERVFGSIGNFNHDTLRFHGLLHRLAFSSDSLASKAIIEAASALSSLYRFGLGPEAMRLKISALKNLGISSKNGMSATEGIQHIAAAMMLCYFEIEDIQRTTVQWMLYVCGSKHLMQVLKLRRQSFSSEFSAVLDWVDYHFVVGMFTYRHWRQKHRRDLFHARGTKRVMCMRQLVPNLADCPHQMIDLLYEVINTVKRPTDEGYFSVEYATSLDHLEHKIHSVHRGLKDPAPSATDSCSGYLQLYQIASLIYLERASRNFSGRSTKIDALVERGYHILRHSDISNVVLPVFILGLEAKEDGARMLILELIDGKATGTHLRSLEAVNRLLQFAWVQDDLETEKDVDYVLKLDTIITSNSIIPALA